jgi:protein-disulfide isomerase
MTLRELGSHLLLGVSVACAVVVTGMALRREYAKPLGSSSTRLNAAPLKPVSGWGELIGHGHVIGNRDAQVKILEFGDFECPACRIFETKALAGIRARFPEQVSIVFRHWPLSYHRFAYPTARAAECAASQGRFVEFHYLVFSQQDSLGLKPYVEFARQSGVSDLVAFSHCTALTNQVPEIDEDNRVAVAIGGPGTPTVLVNGLLLPHAPDSLRLDSLVTSLLAHKSH